MRSVLSWAMLLATGSATLGAQPATDVWRLTGIIGAQFRSERGRTIDGALFELGFIPPSRDATRWEFDAGIAQMLARDLANTKIIENSAEAAVLVMRDLLRRGEWRLEGGVGPVAALGTGCRVADNQPDAPVSGSIACVNPAANVGTARVGARARLLGEWTSPRASFYAALLVSAHTVASADGVAPGLAVGVRAPMP